MTSITMNLTLEQVLEFVQNLPLEYKQAIKQKLEEEKVEEIKQQETTNSVISDFVDVENDCNTEQDSRVTEPKEEKVTLVDIDDLQSRIEKLQEDNELNSSQKESKKPKKSKVDQIAGLVHDPNAPDSKILISKAIIQRYKERS